MGASAKDIDIVQKFIEWFGTAYSLFLALVLGYVWTQFDNLDREFDLEADALLALHQTCSYISKNISREDIGLTPEQITKTRPFLTEIEKDIVDYVKHVLDCYQSENKDTEQREKGEQLLNEIGLRISQIAYDKLTPDALVQQLFLKLNEAMDIRGDRIAHSKQRMPSAVWLVALVSSIVWLVPFLGLIMDDDLIYFFLAGGAAFVIIMVLIIVKDLDDPFEGAWRVNINSWFQILEVMEPTLIFVYSVNYAGIRVMLAKLMNLPACPLSAMTHEWIGEKDDWLKLKARFLKVGNTMSKELLPIQLRQDSRYRDFHEMPRPIIFYRSMEDQYSLVMGTQDITACSDLNALKEVIKQKLTDRGISFPV